MDKTNMDGFKKTCFGKTIEADGQIICGKPSINLSSILTVLIRRLAAGAEVMPATCSFTGPVCKSRWMKGPLSLVPTYLASGKPGLTMKELSSINTPTTDIPLLTSIGPSGGWTSMLIQRTTRFPWRSMRSSAEILHMPGLAIQSWPLKKENEYENNQHRVLRKDG